jgi:Kef-type K+ transport system membrane component KefB
MHRPSAGIGQALMPVAVVIGISFVVGALLALAVRMALRAMSPASENTSMLVVALIAAATPLASLLGGSAPLSALMSGLLLKQLSPRPWAFQRHLGTVSGPLVTLMFVLVSVVAARAPWSTTLAGLVAALVIARGIAKILGVALANWGSGTNLRQAFWTACAMSPMSAVTVLLASQFETSSLTRGPGIAAVLLPATVLMEVLGAMVATFALHRVRESGTPPEDEGLPSREAAHE